MRKRARERAPERRLDEEGRPLPESPGYVYTINEYLQETFGEKVIKLSLDGGFTCPNRDGSKGTGGCIFCSAEGSGELAGTIPEQIELLKDKWPGVHTYLAYFQSHTSTYAPVEELREKYEAALMADPRIKGLVIATRPDCLGEDVLELLDEMNRKTFLWVELGLQTIHGDRINRCYDLPVYDKAVRDLSERGIRVVTHLILGLPGETREMMEDSVRYITSPITLSDGSTRRIFGLKLHLLNVIKDTALDLLYPGYVPFETPEEYVSLVCDLLEEIPSDITVHRLTGDVPRTLLKAPEWSYKKRTILNGIAREMTERGSWQGKRLE